MRAIGPRRLGDPRRVFSPDGGASVRHPLQNVPAPLAGVDASLPRDASAAPIDSRPVDRHGGIVYARAAHAFLRIKPGYPIDMRPRAVDRIERSATSLKYEDLISEVAC